MIYSVKHLITYCIFEIYKIKLVKTANYCEIIDTSRRFMTDREPYFKDGIGYWKYVGINMFTLAFVEK